MRWTGRVIARPMLAMLLGAAGCAADPSPVAAPVPRQPAAQITPASFPASVPSDASADHPPAPRFRVGRIDAPAVAECSGLVASRRHAGVFWAICDSNNAPALHALTREGRLLATFPVDVPNVDWEDLAVDDDGHLYIAETGNNLRQRRPAVIYQLDEPDPAKPPKPNKAPGLPVKRTWRRDFPEPADCEALFIVKGFGHLITKRRDVQPAALYRFDLADGPGPEKLQSLGALPLRAPVTAADVSPDGKWLAVLTLAGPTLFRIDGDVAAAVKAEPKSVLFISPGMEACCFVTDGLLVATEVGEMFLFRWKDFGVEVEDDK